MDADRVVIDTNVLLAATAPSRALHHRALTVFNEWPNLGRRLCVSGQILREYLVVATRPLVANGLGLDPTDALANASTLAARMRLLDEDEGVALRLRELVRLSGCSGTRIHDANVVATALAHGVGSIVTANVADFQAFAAEVQVVDLAEVE